MSNPHLRSLELCAGGGGQALGLESAGFHPLALVELDRDAVATLRQNRPSWSVVECDLNEFDARPYRGLVDLLAAGLPCPPWSRAGTRRGEDDERNLWPTALQVVQLLRPRALMFENVDGILDARFEGFRMKLLLGLDECGYQTFWKDVLACEFGVPQRRHRAVLVGFRKDCAISWSWPKASPAPPPTVGESLLGYMRENGWTGARRWAERANKLAPTIVGGSHKHGGPDLGPTRTRKAWLALGVDGSALADSAPPAYFEGVPRLTVAMLATLQGFPRSWQFQGRKTSAYRQVGNAFPPPVASAIGAMIRNGLESAASDCGYS